MATEWGIPPWDIEARMPGLWRDRWVALKNAEWEKHKRDNPTPGKAGVRKLL